MNCIEVSALKFVPSDAVNENELMRDLVVVNNDALMAIKAGRPTKYPASFNEWIRNGVGFYVPRAYKPNLTRDLQEVWVGPNWKTPGPRYDSGIKLRDYQEEAIQAILYKEGILHLGCGQGKTVIALEKVCRERLGPVLVIVTTTVLKDQWLNMISRHLKYVEGGVGVVGEGKEDWRGRGIVVGLIQSLTQKKWDKEFYNYFQSVIIDEGHRSAAMTYSRIFRRFPGKRLALTATPYRRDGLTKVLSLHCGPILYSNLSVDLKPKIYFLETGCWVYDKGDVMRWTYILNKLSRHAERNQVIESVLRSAYGNKNRKILVLGERVEQLKVLYERFQADSKGLVIGEVSSKDRDDALQKRIVFATSKLCKEGLDDTRLDTLFWLFPSKDAIAVQQGIGRILRRNQEKEKPLVVIFEDKRCPTVSRITFGMRKILGKLGYEWEERSFKRQQGEYYQAQG
jgi:superfamily II DNA or RNA helicase